MNLGAKIDKNEQINKFFLHFSCSLDRKQETGCSHECPVSCDPVGARTQDLLLRRQLLYPAELPDQKSSLLSKFGCKDRHFICNLQIFARKTEL